MEKNPLEWDKSRTRSANKRVAANLSTMPANRGRASQDHAAAQPCRMLLRFSSARCASAARASGTSAADNAKLSAGHRFRGRLKRDDIRFDWHGIRDHLSHRERSICASKSGEGFRPIERTATPPPGLLRNRPLPMGEVNRAVVASIQPNRIML